MPTPKRIDPRLVGLLRAGRDPAARESAVREVLERHAIPLIDRRLEEEVRRGRVAAGDAPDVRNEVSMRLLVRLRRLVEQPKKEAIWELPDYVAAILHNVLFDQQRRADPVRARLVTRVRYVLTHTPGVTMWGRDVPLAGLESWMDREDAVPVARPAGESPGNAEDASSLRRVVVDVLRRSGGPVEVAALVAALAEAAGLATEPFVPMEVLAHRGAEDDSVERIAGVQYLQRLWGEICELPVRQRRALLLQLRLDNGDSVPRVLAALGIASLRTLAAVLEIPLAEMLKLWNQLPLPDDSIGAMLDATRQQVINLRKSARERLARRMRGVPAGRWGQP